MTILRVNWREIVCSVMQFQTVKLTLQLCECVCVCVFKCSELSNDGGNSLALVWCYFLLMFLQCAGVESQNSRSGAKH